MEKSNDNFVSFLAFQPLKKSPSSNRRSNSVSRQDCKENPKISQNLNQVPKYQIGDIDIKEFEMQIETLLQEKEDMEKSYQQKINEKEEEIKKIKQEQQEQNEKYISQINEKDQIIREKDKLLKQNEEKRRQLQEKSERQLKENEEKRRQFQEKSERQLKENEEKLRIQEERINKLEIQNDSLVKKLKKEKEEGKKKYDDLLNQLKIKEEEKQKILMENNDLQKEISIYKYGFTKYNEQLINLRLFDSLYLDLFTIQINNTSLEISTMIAAALSHNIAELLSTNDPMIRHYSIKLDFKDKTSLSDIIDLLQSGVINEYTILRKCGIDNVNKALDFARFGIAFGNTIFIEVLFNYLPNNQKDCDTIYYINQVIFKRLLSTCFDPRFSPVDLSIDKEVSQFASSLSKVYNDKNFLKICMDDSNIGLVEEIFQKYKALGNESEDELVHLILSISETPIKQKIFFPYIELNKCSKSVFQEFVNFIENKQIDQNIVIPVLIKLGLESFRQESE